jgi:3'(2'), 5'-bisphosphate nucleotidase
MTTFLSDFAARLAEIAHEAGRLILTHYSKDVPIRFKDDSSPVTDADEAAEALILKALAGLAPDVPVVAEEQMAAGHVPHALGSRFFLVDPLDGTKEFLKRNGEFTVNIALIEGGNPVCGVVVAPAKARAFVGEAIVGAFEVPAPEDLPLDMGKGRRIAVRKPPQEGLTVIASRSHRDPAMEGHLQGCRIARLVIAGSSLKFCLVAAGEADLYPRHGRTMEWDTAAGQAVLEAAGGSVKTLTGARLAYGKIAQSFANPNFVARGAEPGTP